VCTTIIVPTSTFKAYERLPTLKDLSQRKEVCLVEARDEAGRTVASQLEWPTVPRGEVARAIFDGQVIRGKALPEAPTKGKSPKKAAKSPKKAPAKSPKRPRKAEPEPEPEPEPELEPPALVEEEEEEEVVKKKRPRKQPEPEPEPEPEPLVEEEPTVVKKKRPRKEAEPEPEPAVEEEKVEEEEEKNAPAKKSPDESVKKKAKRLAEPQPEESEPLGDGWMRVRRLAHDDEDEDEEETPLAEIVVDPDVSLTLAIYTDIHRYTLIYTDTHEGGRPARRHGDAETRRRRRANRRLSRVRWLELRDWKQAAAQGRLSQVPQERGPVRPRRWFCARHGQ